MRFLLLLAASLPTPRIVINMFLSAVLNLGCAFKQSHWILIVLVFRNNSIDLG